LAKISAGFSLESTAPVGSEVNTEMPHRLSSDVFEGWNMAYLKGFVDEDGNMRESEYFRGKTVWASLGVYKDKVRVHFCE